MDEYKRTRPIDHFLRIKGAATVLWDASEYLLFDTFIEEHYQQDAKVASRMLADRAMELEDLLGDLVEELG